MKTALFYDRLRNRNSGVFGSKISQQQVDGIEAILAAFDTDGDGQMKSLAYTLATAYHETGATFLPVREGFKTTDASARAYVQRNYGHKGKNWYCWPIGAFGLVYYGRGLAQLTWYENYKKMGNFLGVNLVNNPDLALEMSTAARILVIGIATGFWNGHGHGIAHYLPADGGDDIKNARRTVNITDKWQTIGGYYQAFLSALTAAEWHPATENATPEAPVTPPRANAAQTSGKPLMPAPGLLGAFFRFLKGLK